MSTILNFLDEMKHSYELDLQKISEEFEAKMIQQVRGHH
jgi:hypothetical protein